MSCPKRQLSALEIEFLEAAIAAGQIEGYDMDISEDGLTVNTTIRLKQPVKFVQLTFAI